MIEFIDKLLTIIGFSLIILGLLMVLFFPAILYGTGYVTFDHFVIYAFMWLMVWVGING